MLDVALDHPRFIILNKPPGVGMHQEGADLGIVTLAKQQLGEDLYPVHRLDKVTSGALILARDSDANRELSELFRDRAVEKFYIALSARRPAKKQGLIVGDMERSRRATWMLSTQQTNPAVTQFFSGSVAANLRWFLLKPTTGKTHQLRVALKSLSAPVLGDTLYGSAEPTTDRAYLHAWGLRFRFQQQSFELLVPPLAGELFLLPSFQTVLEELNQPWQLPWPALPAGIAKRIARASADLPTD